MNYWLTIAMVESTEGGRPPVLRLAPKTKGEINFMRSFLVSGSRPCTARMAPVSVGLIQSIVAEYFGVSLERMLSKTHALSRPRQVAMFLARQMTGWSLPQIARAFERDSSTVHYAIERVAKLMAGEEFAATLREVEEAVLKEAVRPRFLARREPDKDEL